jgi:hypothetical protein
MKRLLFLLLLLSSCCRGFAQNVGIGNNSPHPSALLDMTSSNKGFLPPRMSWTQIQSITSPAAGLMVFDTGIKGLRLYTGTRWVIIAENEKQLGDAPGGFSETAESSNGNITPKAVAMGSDKSVYVTGSFTGNASIGGITLNGAGQGDVFIAKFDSLGLPVWVKVMGSNSIEAATDITLDAVGNIYICGFFLNNFDIDPGPGVTTLTGLGGYDGFYAKFDNNGNLVWGKKISGTFSEFARSITTDGTNVYITGEFSGQVNFNPSVLTSYGGDDIFVARYQCTNGNMGISGWAIKMGSLMDDGGLSIKMYGNNIIVGGYFKHICDFAGTTKTSFGEEDGFFSEHSAAGTLLEVHQLGGTGTDIVNAVAEDIGTSTIFAAGSFSNTADFDSRPANTLNKTSNGGLDAFLVRYQAGFPFWVLAFGSISTEEIKSIASDDFGNTYAIGRFGNTVSFDLFNLTSYGGMNAFVLKADVGGNISWVQQAGGRSSDYGEDVVTDSNGKLIFSLCIVGSDPFLTFNNKKIFSSGFYLARYEE